MDDGFPTLQLVLEKIDPNCGFNIELKWDMLLKDGSNECQSPFEINSFIDIILEIVHKSKKSKYRKIVFSSFSPDVCTV
jgi:glycerophosphocholine phosphodiesterase GPCPD1